MLRKLGCALALIPALWLAPVHALGLGDVDVRSRLNQRFSATIPVVDATPEDIESLTVRLASPTDFERGGVDRVDYLTSLSFSLDPTGRVAISSKQISREPLLNFIVEARWRGGRLLREYTVFLDPPADAADTTASAVPAPAKPVPVPVPAAKPRAEPVAPAATRGAAVSRPPTEQPEPLPSPPSASVAPKPAVGGTAGSYGPVASQETLWSIGTKVRPGADVTMDQVLLALYETNPEAFVGGINGLQKNVTLSVPDSARMQSVDADTAKARVARLRSGRAAAPVTAAARSPAATVKPVVPKAQTPVSKAAPRPTPTAAATASSSGSSDAASVADRLAGTPAPASKPSAAVAAESPPTKSAAPAAVVLAPAPTASSSSAVPTASPARTDISATGSPGPAVSPAAVDASTPAASSGPGSATAVTSPSGAAAVPATVESRPVTAVPPATPAAAAPVGETGFLDGLLIPILVIVVILLLIALLLWRRRQSNRVEPPPIALTPKSNLRTAASIGAAAGAVAATAAIQRTAPEASAQPQAPSILDTPDPLMNPVTLNKPASGSSLGRAAESNDFDRVAAKDARPLSVTLDSNDPLSEADFHLAYGLFDEAASLLKKAIDKDPQRVALQVKLAETYFAAGKSLEFQETAEAMQGRVSEAEWQKIVVMGRKLCPGTAVFKDGDDTLEPDLDLSFDAPAELVIPAAAAPSAPVFSIADVPAVPAAVSASATASAGVGLIDFDLEKELLSAPIASVPTKAPAEPEKFAALDLSEFDLSGDSSKKLEDINTIEFNLDELDLSQPAASEASAGFGDEVGTKLDLARAYSDMGDNEAARGLLDEVIAGGSVTQKQEAEALLKRLSA